MKEEIAAAVFFVARLAKRHGSLDAESRERFAAALTSALFETYKTHWYPHTPVKGQAYRGRTPCWRRPVVSGVLCATRNLGLPREITIWVDPGEVSCRYGERSVPFCVTQGCHCGDGEFSRRVHDAVERAASDIQSGSSSEGGDTSMSSSCSSLSAPCPALGQAPNPEPKPIPTVSNPNSVYQSVSLLQRHPLQPGQLTPRGRPSLGTATLLTAPPLWTSVRQQQHSQFLPHKSFKPYRATSSFNGPRQGQIPLGQQEPLLEPLDLRTHYIDPTGLLGAQDTLKILKGILKRKVEECKVSNIHQLRDVVMEEWKRTPVATCEALVNSMPKRVKAVLENDGGHTKY
ncbi:hypothetical protein J4Q44_G00130360 [Coregonus suidteri]|uniref:Anti-proliferative protein domain-containing protein n=1 Tax=Coregonus suidteri TaxID=861788 RepID=A0AAN8M553_9TELE